MQRAQVIVLPSRGCMWMQGTREDRGTDRKQGQVPQRKSSDEKRNRGGTEASEAMRMEIDDEKSEGKGKDQGQREKVESRKSRRRVG